MTAWVLDWMRAFSVTLVIEEIVALVVLARFDRLPTGRVSTTKQSVGIARRIAAVALVNLATHPLVWFLFPGLTMRYAFRVALSELWALSAEAVGYATIWPELRWKRAALISLLANGASFGLGLLL